MSLRPRLFVWMLLGTAAGAGHAVLSEELHPIETRVWLPGAHGLDHPQYWSVQVAPDGEVLVASGIGIHRFDGEYWQTLMPTGAPAWIYDIDRDADRIVTGTSNRFGWYGPNAIGNPEFHDVGGPAGLTDFGMVGRVAIAPSGAFYATREQVFWQPGGGPVVTFAHPVGNLFRVGNTVLLDAMSEGLLRFDDKSHRFEPAPEWAALTGLPTQDVASTDGRSGLVLTANRGLWRFDEQNAIHWPTALDELGAEVRTTTLLVLPDQSMLVGTRAHGLMMLDADGRLARRLDRDDGLPGNRVTGMALDPAGGVFATFEGGITRLDVSSGISRYGRADGLSTVMEAVLRHQGQLFAAGSEGVYRLVPRPRRAARFEPLPGPANGVSLVSHEASGDLLIGADSGFWRWRAGTPSAEHVFPGPRIHQLINDPSDASTVYAITSGVRRFRWRDGLWHDDGVLPSFAQANMARAAIDVDGQLWAGTIVGAVHRIKPAVDWTSSDVETYGPKQGLTEGGWAHPMRFGNRLLLGVVDGLYDGPNAQGQFARIPSGTNLRRMVADPEPGRFWSSAGLVSVQGDSFHVDPSWIRRLGRPSPNDLFVDGDSVWIAANEGLFRVPRKVPVRLPRQVRFAGAIFGSPTPGERHVDDPRVSRIEVPTELAQLRLRFAVTDHGLGDPIEFRSRLSPGQNDWSTWTDEAFKDFTELPYGESIFEVEGSDRSGHSVDPLVLTLFRPPPWYLTPWATFGYVAMALVALVLAVAAGRRWRVQALEARARELTEQVEERTETIRRQRDEIAEHSAARTRFFANVSHEFRTPLSLLIGPLQVLRDRAMVQGDAESGQLTATALRNSARLQQMVDEVLDLHRLEAGQIRLHRQLVDIRTLAGQLVDEFGELARPRDITISLEADSEHMIPAHVDVIQIRRCLSNLIGNALKFSPDHRRIVVHVENAKPMVRIAVDDQGPGIPDEDLPRVFDRYFQSEHHQRLARGGTGIGLALVRELVELHGGEVGVTSVLGSGTCVWFTLPSAAADTSPQEIATLAATEATAAVRGDVPRIETTVGHILGGGKTLLLVDDNAELRAFLRSQLESTYRILEAVDGRSGLELARSEIPDLIVTDLMMPIMDGQELVAAVRQDNTIAFIPILMLSARGQKRDIVGALTAGADDYLAKPFDTGELIARITALIAAQHRLAKRLRSEPEAESPAAPAEPAPSAFASKWSAVLARHMSDTTLDVAQLATLLHMDRSTLFRKCQDEFGMGPQELLKRHRLARAHELLGQQRGSVGEVAYAVGFESLSHFSRSYKAEFGKSPSESARERL